MAEPMREQVIVDDKRRYRRLRLLIKKLNAERKKQAQKVDILCNDLIAAQREFIKSLDTIRFTANFYKSIVGITDLGGLFSAVARLISDEISGANIAFFLRCSDSFQLHLLESSRPILLKKQDLESCFTAELVGNVSRSNRICTLDDMFAMGLQGNLNRLNKITAAAIPLGTFGSSFGFVLICRSSEDGLRPRELNNIAAAVPGLSRAIESCRAAAHATD